jgi:DNA-binding LacI/PurR family transcriptional regulator
MQAIPRRQSLVSQTATILREEIRQGQWREWLPGERALCEALQVSRNTLRAAVAQLKREGVIRSMHGAGNRILVLPELPAGNLRSRDVALLSPEALQRLRPSMALWIDELRAMLSERGCRLHLFHGPQYFRVNPGAALEKLVAQHRHGCWVLALSNEPIQRWFERSGVPCVVAGTGYPGVNLPFRDLDHHAICRHAAGVMLGLGHRKIALLLHKSRRAGDLESEAGFLEGVRASPHKEASASATYHAATVGSISAALRRLMNLSPPPTALLVANAYHYLTVVSWLARAGVRVPQDVSVVSRDEDTFLSFLVPAPSRYVASPHTMAKSLLRPVLEMLDGGVVTQRGIRIMPDFVRGETIVAPRNGDALSGSTGTRPNPQ